MLLLSSGGTIRQKTGGKLYKGDIVDALKITRGKRPGSYLIKIDPDGTGDKAW